MKNSEEAIDKLLAGLRAAEPPAGMGQRITARLHHQPAAVAPGRWSYGRFAWLTAPAAAALLVCALIFQAMRHRVYVPTQPARPDAKEVVAMPQPVRAETSSSFVQVTPAPRAAVRLASKFDSKTGATHDMEALAKEEMRAESKPAPPLPLSDQEKLLLRMTHRKTPIELAALSPAIRAQHDADEEADFQQFFEPPKPPADSQ